MCFHCQFGVDDTIGTRVVHPKTGKTYEVVQVDDLDEWIHAWDLEKERLKTPEEYLPAPCEGATEVWEYGVDLKYYKFVHVKEVSNG
jgi:hypothetical protein